MSTEVFGIARDLRTVFEERAQGRNPVPGRYRNVINPWQTPKEIRNGVKFIEAMLRDKGYDKARCDEILCVHLNVNWSKPR